MNCGGATDGKANTDTTTFQSEQPRPMMDTASGMHVSDTNDAGTPTPNGAPASSPASRSLMPGNGRADSSTKK